MAKQFPGRGTDERPKGVNLTTGLNEQSSFDGLSMEECAMGTVGKNEKPMAQPKSQFIGEYRGGDSFGWR
jgi:hypothetical protein